MPSVCDPPSSIVFALFVRHRDHAFGQRCRRFLGGGSGGGLRWSGCVLGGGASAGSPKRCSHSAISVSLRCLSCFSGVCAGLGDAAIWAANVWESMTRTRHPRATSATCWSDVTRVQSPGRLMDRSRRMSCASASCGDFAKWQAMP